MSVFLGAYTALFTVAMVALWIAAGVTIVEILTIVFSWRARRHG